MGGNTSHGAGASLLITNGGSYISTSISPFSVGSTSGSLTGLSMRINVWYVLVFRICIVGALSFKFYWHCHLLLCGMVYKLGSGTLPRGANVGHSLGGSNQVSR